MKFRWYVLWQHEASRGKLPLRDLIRSLRGVRREECGISEAVIVRIDEDFVDRVLARIKRRHPYISVVEYTPQRHARMRSA